MTREADTRVSDETKDSNEDDSPRAVPEGSDPFLRAENEDDDGYDPYSDRRPTSEPLFECDPWS